MSLKNFDPVSVEQINSARERFFSEEYVLDPLAFDPIDIDSLKNDDWLVKRFLISTSNNEREAVSKLSTALRWRKEVNLHHIKDSDFMIELYSAGSLFLYEKDKHNNRSLVMRLKYMKRINEFLDDMKKFCMYLIHKIDSEIHDENKGWVIVLDLSGLNMSHVAHIDVVQYFISSLSTYFPSTIERVLVLNLPWVLSSVCNVIKLWIPEKRRHIISFIKKSQLTEYFDLENLPPCLGGTCTKSINEVPHGCPTAYEFAKRIGLDEIRCREIQDEFDSIPIEN